MIDLSYEIQELYIEGHSAKTIALILDCSLQTVIKELANMSVEDNADEAYDY